MTDKERQEREKKKKKRQSELEMMIFQLMEKSAKKALETALDEIFKDWK